VAEKASKPFVDRRLFVGLLVVLGAQATVWYAVALFWFAAGGTLADYLGTAFFGILFSVPLLALAFAIGLGPGMALWLGLMAACQLGGFTERTSARIAAPLAAMILSATCLLGMYYSVRSDPAFGLEVAREALLFSAPATITAFVYATAAWPRNA
jgi:hypothetical protein